MLLHPLACNLLTLVVADTSCCAPPPPPPPAVLLPGRASVTSSLMHPSKHRGHTFSWTHMFDHHTAVTHQKGAKQKQAGMQQRHAHLAHNPAPNALVVHLQDGVEVVHLYTGRV